MTYVTVVLEYKAEDQEPSFFAKQPVLGGKVIAVQFDDALERIEELEKRIEELEDKYE